MAIKRAKVTPSQEIYLDEFYFIPNFYWVKDEFSKSLESLKKTLKISTWWPENNDCDNFSCAARFLANLLNTNSTMKQAGLAFGEFYYITRQGGGHAINFFISKPDGELEVFFLEPQDGKIVTLTEEEKQSCLGIII